MRPTAIGTGASPGECRRATWTLNSPPSLSYVSCLSRSNPAQAGDQEISKSPAFQCPSQMAQVRSKWHSGGTAGSQRAFFVQAELARAIHLILAVSAGGSGGTSGRRGYSGRPRAHTAHQPTASDVGTQERLRRTGMRIVLHNPSNHSGYLLQLGIQ